MPCKSDYLNATSREAESARVLEFLREVDGESFDHSRPAAYYGRVATLDEDTARLCAWCEANVAATKSLELQPWWRKHREADERREAREDAYRTVEAVRQRALGKLTAAEREALGVMGWPS